jgi:LmbE family N-acetylglucosaminyl deacetylase
MPEPISDPSPLDLYLSPHSDDICFSLGALAHKRHIGTLLTILPISNYALTLPDRARPSADDVTRARKAEDMAFARSCGLTAGFLDLRCIRHLGRSSRDLGWVEENAQRIEPVLIKAINDHAAPIKPGLRPWLFCPGGIGGHIDHVAVRIVVARNFDRLARRYRIGFYEDLHYASQALVRAMGLAALLEGLPGRTLQRHAWPLRELAGTKLALIGLYPSQFNEPPQSLGDFTPYVGTASEPHEAIWSEEPVGPA